MSELKANPNPLRSNSTPSEPSPKSSKASVITPGAPTNSNPDSFIRNIDAQEVQVSPDSSSPLILQSIQSGLNNPVLFQNIVFDPHEDISFSALDTSFWNASRQNEANLGQSLPSDIAVRMAVETQLARRGGAMARPLIAAATADTLASSVFQRTFLQAVKTQGVKAAAKASASVAARTLGRTLLGLTVGMTPAGLVVSAVMWAGGEYVLCNYVIPKANEAMDDSQIRYDGSTKVDNQGNTSMELTKFVYKDNYGRGEGQCVRLELQNGKFTMRSSNKITGESFFKLSDSSERDLDILPRALEEVENDLILNIYLKQGDEETSIAFGPGSDDHQIQAVIELTAAIKANDNPGASEHAMKMATRHLLELSREKSDDKSDSLHKLYIDLYKESLRQHKLINGEQQYQSYQETISELEDAISLSEEYLKSKDQNFDEVRDALNSCLDFLSKKKNLTEEEMKKNAELINNYVFSNAQEFPELLEIPNDLSMFQKILEHLELNLARHQERSLRVIDKDRSDSPQKDAWQKLEQAARSVLDLEHSPLRFSDLEESQAQRAEALTTWKQSFYLKAQKILEIQAELIQESSKSSKALTKDEKEAFLRAAEAKNSENHQLAEDILYLLEAGKTQEALDIYEDHIQQNPIQNKSRLNDLNIARILELEELLTNGIELPPTNPFRFSARKTCLGENKSSNPDLSRATNPDIGLEDWLAASSPVPQKAKPEDLDRVCELRALRLEANKNDSDPSEKALIFPNQVSLLLGNLSHDDFLEIKVLREGLQKISNIIQKRNLLAMILNKSPENLSNKEKQAYLQVIEAIASSDSPDFELAKNLLFNLKSGNTDQALKIYEDYLANLPPDKKFEKLQKLYLGKIVDLNIELLNLSSPLSSAPVLKEPGWESCIATKKTPPIPLDLDLITSPRPNHPESRQRKDEITLKLANMQAVLARALELQQSGNLSMACDLLQDKSPVQLEGES